MIIQNLNPIELCDDIGKLFEKYFVSEKMKHIKYNEILNSVHYWRTKNGQEIDFVEVYKNGLEFKLFECKGYNKGSKSTSTLPNSFGESYENYTYTNVSKDTIIGLFTEVKSNTQK